MTYYTEVADNVLDYRDNRDRARTELRNILRRIQNKVDARVAAECALADAEGRAVALDVSADGLRRLIVSVVSKELSGGSALSIDN